MPILQVYLASTWHSIKSCFLFDPDFMAYYNPHITGQHKPLYNPTNRGEMITAQPMTPLRTLLRKKGSREADVFPRPDHKFLFSWGGYVGRRDVG